MKVCPQCHSPFLETTVLATAKFSRNHAWELDYAFPVDIEEAIIGTDAEMDCSCGWDGPYSSTMDVPMSDDVYDNDDTPAIISTKPILRAMEKNIKYTPVDIGDVLTIPNDNLELVVVTKSVIGCMYEIIENNSRDLLSGNVIMYTAVDTDTTMYRDRFHSFSSADLARMEDRGDLIITKRAVIEPSDANTEDAHPDTNATKLEEFV